MCVVQYGSPVTLIAGCQLSTHHNTKIAALLFLAFMHWNVCQAVCYAPLTSCDTLHYTLTIINIIIHSTILQLLWSKVNMGLNWIPSRDTRNPLPFVLTPLVLCWHIINLCVRESVWDPTLQAASWNRYDISVSRLCWDYFGPTNFQFWSSN